MPGDGEDEKNCLPSSNYPHIIENLNVITGITTTELDRIKFIEARATGTH